MLLYLSRNFGGKGDRQAVLIFRNEGSSTVDYSSSIQESEFGGFLKGCKHYFIWYRPVTTSS